MQSFPYVRVFRSYEGAFGIHFLASMHPIERVGSPVLASRIPSRAASDFLEWGPDKTVESQLDLVLSREIPIQQIISEDAQVPPTSDDRPINEYFLLRKWFNAAR